MFKYSCLHLLLSALMLPVVTMLHTVRASKLQINMFLHDGYSLSYCICFIFKSLLIMLHPVTSSNVKVYSWSIFFLEATPTSASHHQQTGYQASPT